MKKLDATRARQEFAETINQVAYGQHRVVVSRRGKDLAAIVTMADLDLLQRCEDGAEQKRSGSRKGGHASPKRRRAA
jgi:prevent-host-death family protein